MLLTLVALAAWQANGLYDFQGIALRSPIAALKQRAPLPGKYSQRIIVCSDEAGAPAFLEPPREEKLAGVVECSAVEEIGRSKVAADTDLGPDHRAAVRYRFFEGLLYRIEIYPDIGAKDVVKQSLIARFGSPATQEVGMAQNGFGATIDQERSTWTSNKQTIRLTAPDMRDVKMTVIYQDDAAAAQLEERIKRNRTPVM